MLPILLLLLFDLRDVLPYRLKVCDPFDVILPLICDSRFQRKDPVKTFAQVPDRVIFLHTVETKLCHDLFQCCRTVRVLRRYQVDELSWPDIGYNFLIGSDGRVYVGRGWTTVGQFSNSYNEKALGIAFIGNYFNQSPPRKALDVVKQLLECAVLRSHLARNYTIHMLEDIECTGNSAPALQRAINVWFHYEGKVKDYIRC